MGSDGRLLLCSDFILFGAAFLTRAARLLQPVQMERNEQRVGQLSAEVAQLEDQIRSKNMQRVRERRARASGAKRTCERQ